MFRLMIAAAAALTPVAASAERSIVLIEGGDKALVSYSDLNLGSPLGRAALNRRIRHAAGIVCFNSEFMNSFGYTPENDGCYRSALAGGLSQAESVLLAAR